MRSDRNEPLLVIVSGFPASGKTTLARRLAREARLPLVSRDDIKEALFDALGWNDRAWSRQLGAAGWTVMYRLVEVQLAAGCDCIVESNFSPSRARDELRSLCRRAPFEPFELHCIADQPVLLERFAARAGGSARHPGHVDDGNLNEIRTLIAAQPQEPVRLSDAVLVVDTTEPARIDYARLLGALRDALGRGSAGRA
jgi:predicted kinase